MHSSVRLLLIVFFLMSTTLSKAQDVKVISINATDLLYAESEDRLIATVSSQENIGNSVCIIDPYFGKIEECYPIGSNPSVLRLDKLENKLYIGLYDAPQVIVFDLANRKIADTIRLGGEQDFLGPFYAEDIEVVPFMSNTIAVARRNRGFSPKHEGVAIYQNGNLLPYVTQGHTGSNQIEFAGPNQLLYGYNNETTEFGFRNIAVSDSGAIQLQVFNGMVGGFSRKIRGDGNRVYGSNGSVISVKDSVPERVGELEFSTGFHLFDDSTRIHTLSRDASRLIYSAFDFASLNLVENRDLNFDISGDLQQAISWGGTDKIAARTNDQLIIFRDCESLITDTITLLPQRYGGCFGDSVTITAPEGQFSYFWSNGHTSDSIKVASEGEYYVSVADQNGCLGPRSNSVFVDLDYQPSAPFVTGERNRFICEGDSVLLQSFSSGNIFQWNNGMTGQNIWVKEEGEYRVKAITENGCAGPQSDITKVIFVGEEVPIKPTIEVIGDTISCEGTEVLLLAPENYLNYEWSNGETSRQISITSSDTYSVKVGAGGQCKSPSSDPIRVTIAPVPQKPTIEQNGDLLASSAIDGNQWFLNGVAIDGANSQFLAVTESGFYAVEVSNGACAVRSDLFSVSISNVLDLTAKTRLRFYPNPVNEKLFHNLEKIDNHNVFVYDNAGRLVKSMKLKPHIDVAELIDGVYFLVISNRKEIHKSVFVKHSF